MELGANTPARPRTRKVESRFTQSIETLAGREPYGDARRPGATACTSCPAGSYYGSTGECARKSMILCVGVGSCERWPGGGFSAEG